MERVLTFGGRPALDAREIDVRHRGRDFLD
jgi:hypothetical protein